MNMLHEYHRLSAGTVIDQRYRIKKLVKAGGMGAVYQAEDQLMDMKLCAIKEMLESFTDPADRRAAIDRFLSEVQVLGSLSHPNIPHVSDHFLENNNFYFVMEYIDGIDLATMLSQKGNPGLEEYKVLEWAIQVCKALEYLHSLKPPIAHRDIKPSNLILRRSDGRILLIDFGIARVTNPSEGFWIGSGGYAPPEQQIGKPEPRSDLYALGAAIHELVTGRKPDSFNFPALKELGVDSPGLEELLKRALEWDPNKRISSATEMKEALHEILGYRVKTEESQSNFQFNKAVNEVKEMIIDPLLTELMGRYGNECYTKWLPRNIEYLVFTLACPTTFELIIVKNAEEKLIEFYEKQGILDKILIGKADPLKKEELNKIKDIIDKYVNDYEKFKNANWQAI